MSKFSVAVADISLSYWIILVPVSHCLTTLLWLFPFDKRLGLAQVLPSTKFSYFWRFHLFLSELGQDLFVSFVGVFYSQTSTALVATPTVSIHTNQNSKLNLQRLNCIPKT